LAAAGAPHHWPGLAAIGEVTARRGARRAAAGGVTVRTRYDLLLSRAFTPERSGALVRAPWDIGNGLHRVLDVVLAEDQARSRKDHGPENPAPLRRLALDLARLLSRRKVPCAASSSAPAGTTDSSPACSPSSRRP
jgi:predicted transposase YbfD/YdcC